MTNPTKREAAKSPVCMFGFDMETDIGSWTPFYSGLMKGTPLLIDLLRREQVDATFFFTGHVARTHPEIVGMVDKAGFEVGCHSLYHETVGDPIFDIPGVYPLLPEEIEHRLEVATKWVAEASGSSPTSFRAPRLWGSTAMLVALERLGYTADASYPLFYYGERLEPYHPDETDWTKPGNMRIVEIPNFADMSMDSEDVYGRDRDQWPIFRTRGADALLTRIDAFIDYVTVAGASPVLSFYLHPWEFTEMPHSAIHYGEGSVLPDPALIDGCGAYALHELERLIRGLKERSARFLSARDIAGETLYV